MWYNVKLSTCLCFLFNGEALWCVLPTNNKPICHLRILLPSAIFHSRPLILAWVGGRCVCVYSTKQYKFLSGRKPASWLPLAAGVSFAQPLRERNLHFGRSSAFSGYLHVAIGKALPCINALLQNRCWVKDAEVEKRAGYDRIRHFVWSCYFLGLESWSEVISLKCLLRTSSGLYLDVSRNFTLGETFWMTQHLSLVMSGLYCHLPCPLPTSAWALRCIFKVLNRCMQ